MPATDKTSGHELANMVIIGTIIFILLVVPFYAGMAITMLLNYKEAGLPFIYKPAAMFEQYLVLLKHWFTYMDRMNFKQHVDFVGPTGLGLLTTIVGLYFFRAPIIDFRPFKRPESLHGDAHWATEGEIRRAGLRAKKGLLLGRTGVNNYLVADDFQHVLLFAPTGSGKGVGFVIPNLLFWEESVVCHDIKLENYELTSGYRKHKLKQDVYVWNPADPNGITHCYNPLDWISEKPGQMVDDCQKICNLVLPEQEFWQNEARSLMLGVMLYLVCVPEKLTTFGEIVRTMRSDDVVYNLAVVLDTMGKKIHPVAYMNIAAFLQKADKERSGVTSTLNSGLELWANPLIDTATGSSDFNLSNLKKKKMTVFCGVTPDNLQRLEPLLKVFYQQASDFLTRHMPRDDEPYGVLFMMDEFPTLGEMPQFQTGIAYFRGYRVKLFLIVQDTQQLKGIYEEAGMNSFLSNSYYRVTFAANNVETANLISQLIGNKTVEQASRNKPMFLDLNPAARTVNISEVQRALLLPQEVITMPRDEQIILIESNPPIRTKKIFYFKDSFFTKRLMDQIPLPTQEPYDPNKPHTPKKPAGDAPEPVEDGSPRDKVEDNSGSGMANIDISQIEDKQAETVEKEKKSAKSSPPPPPAAEEEDNSSSDNSAPQDNNSKPDSGNSDKPKVPPAPPPPPIPPSQEENEQ